jgi:predicted ATPase/DNA-binding XRE family transcriptional regulator
MSEPTYSFGAWVRLRRLALVLTCEQLAQRVGCAEVTVRKIESDERRPSTQVAELLARHLAVPAEQHALFVRVARGLEPADRLPHAGGVRLVVASTPETHAPHDAPAGFLPARLTSFVGRTHDVAELAALLAQPAMRLITLVGPGGIGKTSLAIAAAASSMHADRDAVWFVDLAPVHAPSDVVRAIVQTLAIPEVASVPLATRLLDWLRDKRLLLVLDNFEQVLDAAPLVGEIMRSAPHVRLLVTSRMALRVQGEHEYPVAPLGIHPPVEARQAGDLLHQDVPAEAVLLFAERAQAVQPGFALTDANTPVVTAICSRLDGLPLAIELAASRLKMFTPQALLAQLDRHDLLNVLRSRTRDVVARQQTMRATIEWSYALLDDVQRDFFMRLGIFVGGWSVEAAASICEGLALPTLESIELLVEHSLVQPAPARDEPRFTLLETIRAFALQQLERQGMLAAMRERHARFFLAWAETMEPRLRSSEQVATLARIDAEHDNLRAALGWAQESQAGHAPHLELGLRLAAALADYWRIRGHWGEYLRWIHGPELSDTLPQRILARMLLERVEGFEYLHEQGQAQAAARQSLALFEQSGERWLAVRARLYAAWASYANAAFDDMLRLMEIDLVEVDQLGDAWLRATVRGECATLLAETGQNERALQYCDEAIAIARQTSTPLLIATLLYRRGRLGHGMSDYALEQRCMTEALRLARAVESHELIGLCLFALWAVAGIRGDYDEVNRIGVEYLANQRSLNNPVWTAEVLANLALSAIEQQDARAAQAYLDESRTLTDTVGKPPAWLVLYAAGFLAQLQGDMQRAEQLYAV